MQWQSHKYLCLSTIIEYINFPQSKYDKALSHLPTNRSSNAMAISKIRKNTVKDLWIHKQRMEGMERGRKHVPLESLSSTAKILKPVHQT